MGANSRHLKRHLMPTAWPLRRKNITFITRPQPGSHKREYSVPVIVLLRDILGYAQNAKEARFIVKNQEVKVNGKQVKSVKLPVGLFDVLEMPLVGERYVILFDEVGKVKLVKRKENTLILKITGKQHVKGNKLQLNAMNGHNIFADEKTFKKVSVGDSVTFDPDKKKIVSVIPLEAKTFVYIYDGKFRGQFGQIQDFVHFNGLSKDTAEILINKVPHKTLREYCYPVGLKEEEVKALQ